VRALFESSLEDRLQDQLRRRLHDAVAHRRYPQRPTPPVTLLDVHAPHRLRSVLASSDLVAQFREELPDAPLLDHRQ
jgi:hypothetical protein